MDEDATSDLSFYNELCHWDGLRNTTQFDLAQNSLESIPREFLEAIPATFFIELLSILEEDDLEYLDPDDEVLTHASFKIDFATPVNGCKGIKVCMSLESVSTNTMEGNMTANLVTYSGMTQSSMRSYSFPIDQSITVRQVLETITNKGLQYFKFGMDLLGNFCGCRDFAVQAFYQLQARGYVDPNVEAVFPEEPPVAANLTAYDVLGTGYNRNGTSFDRPIDKGSFLQYTRVMEPYMKYRR
ncbi:hypothetical protein Daesc_000762 [Daldinia eschscholtzii]|uniref:DUF7770 domain-containing protein n=1 Tax=Daldinia eschscholtzii TaxID=292717 RepID=A0AAX6MZ77_9PEZI